MSAVAAITAGWTLRPTVCAVSNMSRNMNAKKNVSAMSPSI